MEDRQKQQNITVKNNLFIGKQDFVHEGRIEIIKEDALKQTKFCQINDICMKVTRA
jgi:hypothetical protein